MGFGARANYNTSATTENGADNANRDVFVPSKSGDRGAQVDVPFFMFPDTPERAENEEIVNKLVVETKVNGRDTFRSLFVRADNPHDKPIWDRMREIAEDEEIAEKDKVELRRELRNTLSKRRFLLNVFSLEVGKAQVLDGSWEEMVRDETSGQLAPKNGNGGGKSEYAKLHGAIATGVSVQDPKKPLKRTTITDPYAMMFTRTMRGEGKGKSFTYSVSLGTIPPEALTLPRYDLEAFCKVGHGGGIWPNDAVQELIDGGDYYAIVERYKIALYPTLIDMVDGASSTEPVTSGDVEDDALFDD